MESVTRQMLSYLIKAIFLFIGGLLVSRNLINQDTLDAIANPLIASCIGIALIVAPFVLRYFRAQKILRIENETIREALQSDQSTPVSVVKQRVLETIRGKN